MPPRRNKQDKSKEAPSIAPSSVPPPEIEEIEDDNHNILQKISNFQEPTTIVNEVFKNYLDLALQKIFASHVEKYTDDFAVYKSLENLKTEIFQLFPYEAKPDTPREATPPPVPVKPDEWAEQSLPNDTNYFQNFMISEIDNFISEQNRKLTLDKINFSNLPTWLKQEIVKNGSDAKRPISSSNVSTVSSRISIASAALKQFGKGQKLKNNVEKQKDVKISPKIVKVSNSSKSNGRLRQFKKPTSSGKARKQPLPPTHGGNFQPSVCINDPKVEAMENRRKALKIGKVRPVTESEMKFIKSPETDKVRRFSEKKVIGESVVLPPIGLAKYNDVRHKLNTLTPVETNKNVSSLPETLVDTLAISEGSSNRLDQGLSLAEEFDKLPPVKHVESF